MVAVKSRSQQRLVRRWSLQAPASDRLPGRLASEEPMAIELDGVRVATTMRTPGNDFELAAGFCFAEGLLDGHDVTQVKYCARGSAASTDFNVVSVSTCGEAPLPKPRLTTTTSSCGFCGTTEIDELASKLDPVTGDEIRWEVLAGAPDLLRSRQELFGATGAVHAAGIVTSDGLVSAVREDVGRHNAVDKLIGRLLLDKALPATGKGLVVSGRASFELVHKAWAAGFRAMVAVSAPTALAAATAEAAGMQLAGFARDGDMTIYA